MIYNKNKFIYIYCIFAIAGFISEVLFSFLLFAIEKPFFSLRQTKNAYQRNMFDMQGKEYV